MDTNAHVWLALLAPTVRATLVSMETVHVVRQYIHMHMHAHYCGVIQFFRMVSLCTSAHVQLGGQVGTARQALITVLPTPARMEEPALSGNTTKAHCVAQSISSPLLPTITHTHNQLPEEYISKPVQY